MPQSSRYLSLESIQVVDRGFLHSNNGSPPGALESKREHLKFRFSDKGVLGKVLWPDLRVHWKYVESTLPTTTRSHQCRGSFPTTCAAAAVQFPTSAIWDCGCMVWTPLGWASPKVPGFGIGLQVATGIFDFRFLFLDVLGLACRTQNMGATRKPSINRNHAAWPVEILRN